MYQHFVQIAYDKSMYTQLISTQNKKVDSILLLYIVYSLQFNLIIIYDESTLLYVILQL